MLKPTETEKLILDAFEVQSRDELRERQRRLVSHIEYLVGALLKTQELLSQFKEAAAMCWLRENSPE